MKGPLSFLFAALGSKGPAKAFLGFLLLGGPAFAEEPDSGAAKQQTSFSFSEERGLEPIEAPGPQSAGAAAPSSKSPAPAQEAQSAKPSKETKYLSSDERKKALMEKGEDATQPVSGAAKTPSSDEGKTNLAADREAPRPDSPSAEKTAEREAPANKEAEDIPKNSLSEGFASQQEGEKIEETGFLSDFSENVSWIFQNKKTKHKIALIPFPGYSLTQGLRLGLRFFAYSSDKKGYYFALAGSKYLFRPFSRWSMSYIKGRRSNFWTESSFIYDNHYENYYGEGMSAALSDLKKLYAHRFMANYQIFYRPSDQNFYTGFGAQLFFRKERPSYQEGETHFKEELFFLLKASMGYDSRDSWKAPKTGAYHQLSMACKTILAWPGAYCRGEGDMRFYLSPLKDLELIPALKNSVLALRGFAGSSFFSSPDYTMTYSLAGSDSFQNISALRGFRENRFRGSKIYFAQAEIRAPLLGKYLGGVLFAELGEVAERSKSFEALALDYGGGLRLALPPNYDMKIRLDLGVGKDRQQKTNYNVTLSFLEAF